MLSFRFTASATLFLLLAATPLRHATRAEADNKADAATLEVKRKAFAQYREQLCQQLQAATKGLAPEVLQQALIGYYNLSARQKLAARHLITVVDFTRPSTEKRLWVIDLLARKVLFNTLVAHGRNSGDNYARSFSNVSESYKSSLGFYVTRNTYQGKHGLSLQLDGQDKDVNDKALSRAIVMHGADYVSEEFVRQHGRLGRSHGCPALPMGLHTRIINTIKEGSCLYLHYPDKKYRSALLNEQQALNQFAAENWSDVQIGS